MEIFKEYLEKIPIIPILAFWCAYLGYDFYSFKTDAGSAFNLKVAEIESAKAVNGKLTEKIKVMNEFVKNLEATKVNLRASASKLDSMKATIAENLDVSEFTRMTTTEAKRVGLTVTSIKPLPSIKQEYYSEQPFEFAFRGAFVQALVFMDRLANLQRVVRIDNFTMKPIGSSMSRIVELEGVMQITGYRYLGSKADELGRAQDKPIQKENKGAGA